MKYEQFKEFLGKAHIGDYVSIKHKVSAVLFGREREEINYGFSQFAYIAQLDRVQVLLTSNDPFYTGKYRVIGQDIHYPDIIEYEIRNDLKPSNLESRVVSQ